MPKPPLKWDDERGICPYGHEAVKCQKWKITNRPRLDGAPTKPTRYCSINALDNEKRRRADAKSKRELAEQLKAAEQTGYEIGDQRTGNRVWANVTLVCGHELEFKRAYLPSPRSIYPGVMLCELCDGWKDVHEIDAFEEGQRGMIFRPLEVRENDMGKGNGRNTPLSSPKFCNECGRRRTHKESCSRGNTPLNDPEFRFSNSPEIPENYRPKLSAHPGHLELDAVTWLRKSTGFNTYGRYKTKGKSDA